MGSVKNTMPCEEVEYPGKPGDNLLETGLGEFLDSY